MNTLILGDLHKVDGYTARVSNTEWEPDSGDVMFILEDSGREIWLNMQDEEDLARLDIV